MNKYCVIQFGLVCQNTLNCVTEIYLLHITEIYLLHTTEIYFLQFGG